MKEIVAISKDGRKWKRDGFGDCDWCSNEHCVLFADPDGEIGGWLMCRPCVEASGGKMKREDP